MRTQFFLLLITVLLLPCCRRGVVFASAPAWRVNSAATDAIAVLRRDSGSPRILCAVWLRVPEGARRAGSSTAGSVDAGTGRALARYELRAELSRGDLGDLTLLAVHTQDDSPRDARLTLDLGGKRFDLADGRVFLVDARAEQVTVIQSTDATELDTMTEEAMDAWLRKLAAEHPSAAKWR